MDILIFIIMVAVVILNVQKKSAKKKPQTVQQANQRVQQRNSQQQYTKPNQTKQTAAGSYQKQYRAPEQKKSNKTMAHVDIRVAEELKHKEAQFHSMSGARNVVPIEVDTDVLMSKVNDLMVTGYNGKLSYSRDFIAEGIDMLNRIQE